MIQSGKEIKRLGLLRNAEDRNYQAQGCDIRMEKVFCPVNKPFGEKITEDDYVQPIVRYKNAIVWGTDCQCLAQVWDEDKNLLYYTIPPETACLFKIMETVDLSPKVPSNEMSYSLDSDGTRKTSGKFNLEPRYFNAYVLPKSSLSRRGVIVHSAWWDAGYVGSGFVLVRTTQMPLTIKPGVEFAQMVFLEGSSTDQLYDGKYQYENLKKESEGTWSDRVK